MSTNLGELETPAVVVDRACLEQNLGRIRTIASENGLRVRPHAKTHKCRRIAELQVEHGAVGLTCAKVSEGLYFLASGIQSLTIAYPLVSPNKVRSALAEAAYLDAELRLTVDSDLGVQVVDQVATELGVEACVFVKVDVGLHRCGLEPSDLRLADVAVEIDRRPALRFAGILSHAGHAYAARNEEQVRQIAEDERRMMVGVANDLLSRGLEVPEVSVGSTPTVLACRNFEGITEIRPGNYVFMDRTPLRLGLIDANRITAI
jgi:D-serine deaminase-like pyridoxal phosphate-dependent protein